MFWNVLECYTLGFVAVLTPPLAEMFMGLPGQSIFAFRNMNANILLTGRKVYEEARDVILRRAQLVKVSVDWLYPRVFLPEGQAAQARALPVCILTGWSGISVIHPKYSNLCNMHHHSRYQFLLVSFPEHFGGHLVILVHFLTFIFHSRYCPSIQI